MSAIKTLDELRTLRDKHRETLLHRDASDTENGIRITVGMATCGIASGSRETLLTIIDELKKQNVENATVVQTGCMGCCYAEPTVEVRIPNQPPILYGKIDKNRAAELVTAIKNGEIQKDWQIDNV